MRLYSSKCPKCRVLEAKIKQKNLECEVIEDMDKVLKFAEEHNLTSAPILELDNNVILDFSAANKYLNEVK